MTESLPNKKKITKFPKKEAGGDERHVYFFTRPYKNVFKILKTDHFKNKLQAIKKKVVY